MVIMPIDKRDHRIRVGQPLGRIQACKAGSDDDDVGWPVRTAIIHHLPNNTSVAYVPSPEDNISKTLLAELTYDLRSSVFRSHSWRRDCIGLFNLEQRPTASVERGSIGWRRSLWSHGSKGEHG